MALAVQAHIWGLHEEGHVYFSTEEHELPKSEVMTPMAKKKPICFSEAS